MTPPAHCQWRGCTNPPVYRVRTRRRIYWICDDHPEAEIVADLLVNCS